MKVVKLSKTTIKYKKSLSKVRQLKIDDDKLNKFIDNPLILAFMVIDEEEVIGFAWGYIQERFDNRNMLYIHSVDVIEKAQNKGVGTLLIKTFIDYAKEHNFRNTFLITDEDNIAANKLYSKFTDEIEKNKILYIFK